MTAPVTNGVDTAPPAWEPFMRALYRHCSDDLCVQYRAFPNSDGGAGGAVTLASHDDAKIARFIKREGGPGRGVYFGVSLLRAGATKGGKNNIAQAPAAYVDIDCVDKHIDREEALRALLGCRHPPSMIVDSGRGVHCYFLFKEPLNVDNQTDDHEQGLHEAINRGLARVFAGDTAATDCSRILRVPGTTNTKYGVTRDVTLIHQSDAEYDPSDLQDWMADREYEMTPPLVAATPPKSDETTNGAGDDGFADYANSLEAPVDVSAELAAMAPGNIHPTLLRVVGALVRRGETPGRVADHLVEQMRAHRIDEAYPGEWSNGGTKPA